MSILSDLSMVKNSIYVRKDTITDIKIIAKLGVQLQSLIGGIGET